MTETCEMDARKIADMQPVAALLGWLLLFAGVGNVMSVFKYLYNYVYYYHSMMYEPGMTLQKGVSEMNRFMQGGLPAPLDIGGDLLGLAGIIVGVGLLRRAR